MVHGSVPVFQASRRADLHQQIQEKTQKNLHAVVHKCYSEADKKTKKVLYI